MQFTVGIDPGVNTGVAIWHKPTSRLLEVGCYSIIAAMDRIVKLGPLAIIELRYESAHLRKWFGSKGPEALQGAGSIKRDSTIWAEFCEFHGIKGCPIAPQKGATKWTAEYFRTVTGWQGRTNQHGRDAALLVLGG
jgi:hypothetical protein